MFDKNFIKWINEKNFYGSINLEKGSVLLLELLSSDVEFSVCLLVISCIEDSGISFIVRDEELEEILFNNF